MKLIVRLFEGRLTERHGRWTVHIGQSTSGRRPSQPLSTWNMHVIVAKYAQLTTYNNAFM